VGEGHVGGVAAAALMLLSVSACSLAAYQCSDDEQCPQGSCIGGACAFVDDACASGMRFGAHSAGGVGGECVPLEDGTSTLEPTTESTSSSTSLPPLESSSSGSSTTGTEGSSTTGERDMSTTGSAESSSTGQPPNPDLVAWFSCDDQGQAIGVDATGNGNDGVCMNCPSSGPGVVGQSCEFDGMQSLVVPADPAFFLEEVTLAAWFQVEPLPDGVLLSAAGIPLGAGTGNAYQFGFNGLGPTDEVFFCYGSLENQECINDSAVIGDWMHVAVTSSMEGARVYVDGTLGVTGPAIASGYGMQDFLIGVDLDGGSPAHPFVGRIDELRVYSRALTDEEVAALATP